MVWYFTTKSGGIWYFPGQEVAGITPPSKPTRLAQQRIIFRLFDYHSSSWKV